MQTSAELVRNAIRRKPVDRLPLSFSILGETDTVGFFMKNAENWKPAKEKKPFVMWSDYATGRDRETGVRKEDEWGCIWEVAKGTYGIGVVVENPLKDLNLLEDYEFPDPYAPGRFDRLDELIDQNRDKYVSFWHVVGLFERLHFLHGFNETLIDLLKNREKIEKLLDKIVGFHLAIINTLGKEFGDSVQQYHITDDWGSQTKLFISPTLWREVFKNRYKRLADEVHKYDMDFSIHSDGNLEQIIEDFIEIGVDALNLPQPSSVYGIEKFGQRFGGRIGLYAFLDIQTTGVSGSKEKIIQEAEEIVKYWSNEEGSGLVACGYADIESIGGDLERTRIALQAFKKAFEKKKARIL